MKLNIYRRKDGRFEGRLAVGKKADGKILYKYVYAYSYEECSMRLKMLQDQTVNERHDFTGGYGYFSEYKLPVAQFGQSLYERIHLRFIRLRTAKISRACFRQK